MARRDLQSGRSSSVVARILFCLVLLNQEVMMVVEGGSAGDPAEVNAVNCKSIGRFMTATAINNTKYAKVCNAMMSGILLTIDEVTGCIADKILVDERQSVDLVDSACRPRSSVDIRKRSKRSLALDFTYSSNPNKKWPLPINYTVSLNNSGAETTKQIVRNVMDYMSRETCVTFNPQDTVGKLDFQEGSGCLAYVGRSENPLTTTIVLENECFFSFGEILSLITLTLGLADDSLRPDYRDYIFVNGSNIDPSNTPVPFLPPNYITYNLPYDYASVLHAFPLKFTTNRQITYRTNDPWYQNTIGQRSQLSFIDTKLINLLYCSGKCSGVTNNCEKGGYPDPNDCTKCKCPDGWDTSNRCTTVASHDIGQCGQQFYNLTGVQNGTIQSPGYDTPGYYNPRLSCIWFLTAPVGSHIKIMFSDRFGIYCKYLACYDWVEIRFNRSLNETGPRFCCDKPLVQTIKSTDNQMMILFRSFSAADSSYAGFQIKFEVDPCTVVWSPPTKDIHSFNGIEAAGPLSKEGCMATCDVTPWCTAVDIDYSMIDSTRYPRCFLHSDITLATGAYFAQGIDQYRAINKCYITTTTTAIISSATTSSTTVATLTIPLTTVPPTPTLTATTSTTTPTTTSTTASTPTSTTTLATTSAPTSTTTLTTTSISGLEKCFIKLNGQHSSGAEKVQSGQSVGDCLRVCLNNGCAGVDFVQLATSPFTECWSYNDPQKMRDKYPNSDITQYNNICNVSTTTTTSTTILPTTTSTTTATTATTTTTATASRSTFSYGPTVCPTTTIRRLGIQSSGATRNPTLSTEADCLNYCLATLSCVGVDVVMTMVPNECWIYSDFSQLSNKYGNPSVTQYELTRNCASSTTTAAGVGSCQNTWVIYNSSHSAGATKTWQPMLLAECLNHCASDSNCVAVDFNSAANPVECWVHTNIANINVRYSNPSLTQYVLSSRCPTSPAPPYPGCGGGNGKPGEFCPPCSNPVYPPRTCQKQVITFVFQGGCWTQRWDMVNSPCVVWTCYGTSQLVTVYGTQKCVEIGWSEWCACSASCGSFGTQRRYRYAVVNNQYVTLEEDERVCNTQACPCSTRSCSRCCNGYFESNGFCYRWGK